MPDVIPAPTFPLRRSKRIEERQEREGIRESRRVEAVEDEWPPSSWTHEQARLFFEVLKYSKAHDLKRSGGILAQPPESIPGFYFSDGKIPVT